MKDFDPFRDLKKLLESVDATRRLLATNDISRTFRQIESQVNLYRPMLDSVAEHAKQLTAAQSAFRPIIEDFKIAQAAGERMASLVPDLERLAERFEVPNLVADWVKQLDVQPLTFPDLPTSVLEAFSAGRYAPLGALRDASARLGKDAIALEALTASFAGRFASTLSDLATATDPSSFESAVLRAESEISTYLPEARRSPISLEGFIQILLTLLVLAYSQASQLQQEERLTALVLQVESRILGQLEDSADEAEAELFDVADVADVRSRPGTDEEHVGRIYPGRLVKRLEISAEWTRVEFFDDLSGDLRTGWVESRHLVSRQ